MAGQRKNARMGMMGGAIALALLAACAEVPQDPEERAEFEALNDPIEPFNRQMFDLNMALDRAIMKPVARFYVDAVPDTARDKIHNFLLNLSAPYIFGNDLLQGQPRLAADTLGRFMLNSTFGLLGLFDVAAKDGGPKYHSSDLGQTFGVWGAPEGPYLMLPLYGPSNPREVTAKAVEFIGDPTDSVLSLYSEIAPRARGGVGMIDGRARTLDQLDDLERNSIDLYAAVRSLFRQKRNAEISARKDSSSAPPTVELAPGSRGIEGLR
jgi:phospholipid-binding lipoprotein MlaA